MFRRTTDNLPKDPSYPADLTSLGYKLNSESQIVEIDKPAQFFTFYATDNDRANEVHKEAMHECVRNIVLDRLAEKGVKQIYVNGDGFVVSKPEGPHTTILATEPSVLKEKRDVVVVVNEHMQDLGIWSYRLLMREGGINAGSAVGLVEKLQAWGSGNGTQGPVSAIKTALQKLKLDGAADDASHGDKLDAPGVIILNPGQLIYSHALNTSMAQSTWMARPRATALDDHIRIDPIHNRVPGHETPEAHVYSTFEHIISRLTHDGARLYVVALGEGGEALVNYLDTKLSADLGASIGEKLEAVAFMQPTHTPAQVKPQAVANFLACRGRSWILDEAPMGTLLNTPNILNGAQTLESSTEALSVSEHSASNGHHHETSSSSSSSGQTQAIGRRTRSLLAKSDLSQSTVSLSQSQSTLSKSSIVEVSDEDPDPYAEIQVSCPTFSSGELEAAVPELLWPAVMDDVLAWFKGYAEEGAAHDGRGS
ncbi:hypothetical protein LTR08_001178 [Meristemomyces frigidus]|nr:hypothetical protein LTR08_001178 [Meristemomyces frigidus]